MSFMDGPLLAQVNNGYVFFTEINAYHSRTSQHLRDAGNGVLVGNVERNISNLDYTIPN